MKTLQLSLAAAAAALSSVAAEDSSELCSCTPTSYSLELNFDGTCTSTTGFESDGLEGNLCFFTEGGDPDEIAEEFGVPAGRKLRNNARHVIDSSDAELKKILGNVDLSSHYEHAKQFQTKKTSQFNRRRLQLDTKVTTVTSITFLEQDTSAELEIINQDINVYIDKTRLCQSFENIINNAIKYSSATCLKISLGIHNHSTVLIKFEDDGVGVEDVHLTHLFEHLYRVEDSRNRKTGGSGLGLSICRHIVMAHQGEINAENSPLGGLAIIIKLPIV